MPAKKLTAVLLKKILIIEDNLIVAKVILEMLKDLGFKNILLATSANEAIKLFTQQFDIIFMDNHLPDMMGFELCRIFRRTNLFKDTPVICFTSVKGVYEKECIEAGMDDFLYKPLTLRSLKDILESWLMYKVDSKSFYLRSNRKYHQK